MGNCLSIWLGTKYGRLKTLRKRKEVFDEIIMRLDVQQKESESKMTSANEELDGYNQQLKKLRDRVRSNKKVPNIQEINQARMLDMQMTFAKTKLESASSHITKVMQQRMIMIQEEQMINDNDDMDDNAIVDLLSKLEKIDKKSGVSKVDKDKKAWKAAKQIKEHSTLLLKGSEQGAGAKALAEALASGVGETEDQANERIQKMFEEDAGVDMELATLEMPLPRTSHTSLTLHSLQSDLEVMVPQGME